MYGSSHFMMNFGRCDLLIHNDCNLIDESCSNLGLIYKLPNGIKFNS